MSRQTTGAPGRGRPPKVTAADLEGLALRLWDERGYDAVPLSDVAAAAGVTTRTIFRYFGSKSDIVWNGLETGTASLRARLDETSPDLALAARLRLGIARAVERAEDPIDRVRLRVIGRTPDLHNRSSEPVQAWHTVVRDWVAEQLGVAPDTLEPTVLASAAQAATFASLMWWAENDAVDPGEAVDQGLGSLELLCRAV